MKVTIEIENEEQAKAILELLSEAEEEGTLDFPFNTTKEES